MPPTWRGRSRRGRGGRRHWVIRPLFARLGAVRDARRHSDPTSGDRRAENVHHELEGRLHRRGLRADARRPRPGGSSSDTPQPATRRCRDRRPDRAGSWPGPLMLGRAPILCVGEQLAERERASRTRSLTASFAGRSGRDHRGLGDSDWSSPTKLVWAIGTGWKRQWRRCSPRRRARSATSSPGSAGGSAAEALPNLVRRQRDLGEHREFLAEPSIDRRAGRWRVAQARRDGRHRGTARSDRRAPWRCRATETATRPRPDRPRRPRRGSGSAMTG